MNAQGPPLAFVIEVTIRDACRDLLTNYVKALYNEARQDPGFVGLTAAWDEEEAGSGMWALTTSVEYDSEAARNNAVLCFPRRVPDYLIGTARTRELMARGDLTRLRL